MLDQEEFDETDYYWSNMTKDEQDREGARRSLIRMFPDLNEEELIELEEGKLMRFTVNRVLERMLHDGCPTFNMDRTFDNDVFYEAKEEAYDLMLWVDSEDDTPMPESLKWKPIETGEPASNEPDEDIVIKDDITPTTRKTRGVSLTSKYQKVLALVKEHLDAGINRQDSVQKFIEQFGLNRATAESYYSKAKAALTPVTQA
jgi:hypothetical protein